MFKNLSHEIRQYLLITANYWAFTITDGALRMLVVLYFYQLGYAPLDIALLFAFYELFGVVTNLLGGWLGARLGLNRTMNIGLALQVVALSMLAVAENQLTVMWVMAAQALSGIAKDLNKMSAKSAIKLLVPADASHTLYAWVAKLTGSKNTLKGAGFFIGSVLLALIGFRFAVMAMAAALTLVWLSSIILLKRDLGRSARKPKITQLLSKSAAINRLSIARLFLFAARDVWFVIALPVFLAQQLSWTHWQVGGFMACWVILYGLVQTQAPRITRWFTGRDLNRQEVNAPAIGRKSARNWAALLSTLPVLIALGLWTLPALLSPEHSNLEINSLITSYAPAFILIAGLLVFGFIFAINSSIHSFLIVHYADRGAVSLDVGFYYMANAAGRLIGTLLSGILFQLYGLQVCLIASSLLLTAATITSNYIPHTHSNKKDI